MTLNNHPMETPPQTLPKAVLRFWEIDSSFRCPVVGMCLKQPEQITILKKSRRIVKK